MITGRVGTGWTKLLLTTEQGRLSSLGFRNPLYGIHVSTTDTAVQRVSVVLLQGKSVSRGMGKKNGTNKPWVVRRAQ